MSIKQITQQLADWLFSNRITFLTGKQVGPCKPNLVLYVYNKPVCAVVVKSEPLSLPFSDTVMYSKYKAIGIPVVCVEGSEGIQKAKKEIIEVLNNRFQYL